jgi:hypothetical protein
MIIWIKYSNGNQAFKPGLFKNGFFIRYKLPGKWRRLPAGETGGSLSPLVPAAGSHRHFHWRHVAKDRVKNRGKLLAHFKPMISLCTMIVEATRCRFYGTVMRIALFT